LWTAAPLAGGSTVLTKYGCTQNLADLCKGRKQGWFGISAQQFAKISDHFKSIYTTFCM